MVLKIDASFEDGVFVPASRPALAHGEQVRLTVESTKARPAPAPGLREDRINVGALTVRDLAIVLDFHPDGC